MDEALFDRWKRADLPFNSKLLCNKNSLLVGELRDILKLSVEALKGQYGDAQLLTLDDWHAHDGVVLPSQRATWEDIEGTLVSNDALYKSRNDDDLVYRAFYPSGFMFLLRYDLSNNTNMSGSFDMAAPTPLLARVSKACSPIVRTKLEILSAKEYFDRNYAG